MNGASASQISRRRYRRRILGWGAGALAVVFAVGASVTLAQVEDDLEARSVAVLDDAGVGPVTVRFEGQSGTLRCESGPVEVPAGVLAEIAGLWGVDDVDVDASCLDAPTDDPVVDDTTGTTDADDDTTDSSSTSGPPDTEPEVGSVVELVANDSQFSTLSNLLADAGLVDELDEAGAVTLFAPTNDAFQELGPDVIAALGRDAELLAEVLRHHVVAADVPIDDLTTGELDMLDGTDLAVAVGDRIELGDPVQATVLEGDLVASNGIVHAIDGVLLPDGLDLGLTPVPTVTATVGLGRVTVSGSVVDEAQQSQFLGAAAVAVGADAVVSDLVVDSSGGVDDEAAERFAAVISSVVPDLVEGAVEVTGGEVRVVGVVADIDAEARVRTSLDGIGGVTAELAVRAAATDTDGAALETELNDLVGAEPILFEPGSADITSESAAVLDAVATSLARFGGVEVEIRGHTDTDGLPATNQVLSLDRAEAVVAALAARGVDPTTLSATGVGGAEPVLDASGEEDKAASRRVEFVVSVAPES